MHNRLPSWLLLTLLTAHVGCASLAGTGGVNSVALPWSTEPSIGKSEVIAPDANSSNSVAAALAKGMAHERTGQYDKAREVYEEMLKQHPQRAEPLHRLAVVADKQRRHPEAQSLYTQAIAIQPRNAELFNDLGYSFYLSGNLAKAESTLLKATQMEASNSRFRNNLGMVLGQQGRIEEAFEQFAQAGSEADAHFNVAFLHASQGRTEEAKLCFKRALACDPTHEKASKALDSFSRFEENKGLAIDDQYTADGRRWIPYQETADGQPDVAAMANFGIARSFDSALPPGTHDTMPGNREAGRATRAQGDSTRVEKGMASSR